MKLIPGNNDNVKYAENKPVAQLQYLPDGVVN